MDFLEIIKQTRTALQREGRITYRTLKRQFALDDEALEDHHSLTIFLKDTTYDTGIFAGFLAICDKVPGEEWFITIVYHEWFMTENT